MWLCYTQQSCGKLIRNSEKYCLDDFRCQYGLIVPSTESIELAHSGISLMLQVDHWSMLWQHSLRSPKVQTP